MGTVHAKIKNGVIYPKGNVNLPDGDVLIKIEKRKRIKIDASEDVIEKLASLDLEEMV